MISFKADSFQILDTDTLESISDFNDIKNVTIESEIETKSLSREKLSLNHEATFECELTDCSPLLNYVTDLNNKPLYVEYHLPILIQARWHKKPRINKKWLKRYGMKKDKILIRCNVESFSQDASFEFVDEPVECNMVFSDMQWKFRPDQLRRNLRIEACYE